MSAVTKGVQSTLHFGKIYRVLEKNNGLDPYSIILENKQQENVLLFESGVIALLSPQETEIVKKRYSKLHDAYGCLGILQYSYGEVTILYLVTVTGCVSVGKIGDSEIFKITQTSFISLRNQPQDEDLVSEVKKLLHSGTFYFSKFAGSKPIFDISICSQRYSKTNDTDNRFFWNRMLHIYFVRYGIDTSNWLLKITCGSIEIKTVYIRHRQARAVIVSRLSCERAGTRFNVRGCNDDGHVANFVETEQAIFLDDMITSFLQTRGSVPLFWEQTGVQVGSHRVRISRAAEASNLAYNKHMDTMKTRYGKFLIVNLLNTNAVSGGKEGETMLSQLFYDHHMESNSRHDIPFVIFDYHAECRGGNTKNLKKLKDEIDSYIGTFGVFLSNDSNVVCRQKGVIRTNCLDCLDRTNCTQTFIGLEVLRMQLDYLCKSESQQIFSRFEEVFKQMWVNNGNEISKIYAGTGAIQGGSKLMDGARSAARTIQNNLLDNSKQEAIDIFLLGNTLNSELADTARMLLPPSMLHASTNILREICMRYNEFTRKKVLRLCVGTYNVNGGKNFHNVAYKDVNLSDWLLDSVRIGKQTSLVDTFIPNDEHVPVDIYAVGFQEIVDLNASNIMAASNEHANLWAEELRKVLSRDNNYVLLTYYQLVGVCLFIFVKIDLVAVVKDLAVDTVKTGLGGATGNKGAVAVRFVVDSTSLCFVCSHFAAGQSQVNERNADFAEINKKIAFPMGRTLNTHDYVIWCGDFNYRVDMDKNTMKDLINKNMLDTILQHDQLTIQRKENKVFHDYSEGTITFAPTYKYDTFSDEYDTSEKCRAPAWTDRILWKKRESYPDEHLTEHWNPARLIHYGRSELKQSDHRPVVAVLQIDALQVDKQSRETVIKNAIESVGPLDATIILKLQLGEVGAICDDDFMTGLLEKLSLYGDVILIRFVEETMWITFKDGKSVLNLVNNPILIVDKYKLNVSLKSNNWIGQTYKELNMFSDNTVPLYLPNEDDGDILPVNDELVNKISDVKSRSPSRPPLPEIGKVKAGVFSIPSHPHNITSSQLVTSNANSCDDDRKLPVRPAPPVPSLQEPPPIPKRNSAISTSNNSNEPPPVPARSSHLPPLPPR